MDGIEHVLDEIDQFERYEECISILNRIADPSHLFDSESQEDIQSNVEDWIQKLINNFTKKYISKVMDLKNKITTQEEELEEVHYEYSIIKDENDQLVTFCSSLSSEIGLLKKYLQEADNATKTLREEIYDLRIENRNSICVINEQERENKRLVERMADVSKKLTSEKTFDDSLRILAQEKEVLQEVIDRQSKMIERLSHIEKSNLDLQQVVDELKSENSKLTRMDFEQQELQTAYNNMKEQMENKENIENLEKSPTHIRKISILSPRSAEFNQVFNKKLARMADQPNINTQDSDRDHIRSLSNFISPRALQGRSKLPLNMTYRFASESSKKKYIRIGPLLSDPAESEDRRDSEISERVPTEENDRNEIRPSLMTELLESGNDPSLVLNLDNINVFAFDPNTSLKHTPTCRAFSIIEFENKRLNQESMQSPRVLRIEDRRPPVSDFYKKNKDEIEVNDKVSTTDQDESIYSKDGETDRAGKFVEEEIGNARQASRFNLTILTTLPVYGLMAGISFISTTKELIKDALPWFLV